MYYNPASYFESYIYLSQILQSEVLKTGMETFRSAQPKTMGCMFYHFNDCWPGITWSVQDYNQRLKPAYYTLRRACKNILISASLKDDYVHFNLVNDSTVPVHGILKLQILDFNWQKVYGRKTLKQSVMHIRQNY